MHNKMVDYKEDDIALIVLSTGENVAGKVVRFNKNQGVLTLTDIIYVVPQDNRLMSFPYLLLSAEEEVPFESEFVRHYLTPNEDVDSLYNQQFNKIQTPPTPKIIGS
jgi:hypothetical protein